MYTNRLCPGNPPLEDSWEASWSLKGVPNTAATAGEGYTSYPRPSNETSHAGCITAFGLTGEAGQGMTISSAGYLTFGGTLANSVVELALPRTFGRSGKISLSAWVKSATDSDSTIFETGFGTSEVVRLERGAANDSFRFVVQRQSEMKVAESAANTFPLNTMVHVAVTAEEPSPNNGVVKIYVNGVLSTVTSAVWSISSVDRPFKSYLGAGKTTHADSIFTGEMAHFEIHTGKVLTQAEVSSRATTAYKDVAYAPSPPPPAYDPSLMGLSQGCAAWDAMGFNVERPAFVLLANITVLDMVGGTYTWMPPYTGTVKVFMVGGGGGGGGRSGAGGGAGGVVHHTGGNISVTKGIGVEIVVGNGGSGGFAYGSPGANGEDTTFGAGLLIAKGGGGGGSDNLNQGRAGGSGGGGRYGVDGSPATQPLQPGDSGKYGHGYPGGFGSSAVWNGGGGGGAGGPGGDGSTTDPGPCGDGGPGISFLGAYYGGGGGGGSHPPDCSPMAGRGGIGGGGDAGGGEGQSTTHGLPGAPHTGGGGGAGTQTTGAGLGGAGGSGIVLIYDGEPPTPPSPPLPPPSPPPSTITEFVQVDVSMGRAGVFKNYVCASF